MNGTRTTTAGLSASPSTLSPNPYFAPSDGRCLINDLPAELLSHIFVLGVEQHNTDDDDDDEEGRVAALNLNSSSSSSSSDSSSGSDDGHSSSYDSEDEGSRPPFEILVSHVCKRWREVAIETPTLWCHVEFSRSNPLTKSITYLQRSKGAPISLVIDCADDDDDDDDESSVDANNNNDTDIDMDTPDDNMHAKKEKGFFSGLSRIAELNAVLGLTEPHAFRWRTLDLMVSDYPLMHLALVWLSGLPGAPQLESLSLYNYEEVEETDTFAHPKLASHDFILFSGNLPKLTRVTLMSVHLNWDRSTFLSGLLSLDLAYHTKDVRPSYKTFARILQNSPDLESLVLRQSGPAGNVADWLESVMSDYDYAEGDIPPEAPLTITLPAVTTLALEYLESPYIVDLYDRLALPSVTTLKLDFEDGDNTEFMLRIARPHPLTRKSLLSGLEVLKISGVTCSDDCLVEVFDQLQNLKCLNLNFVFVSDRWYTLLLSDKQQESIYGASSSSYSSSSLPDNVSSHGQANGQGPNQVRAPLLEVFYATGLSGEQVRRLVQDRKASGHPLRLVFMSEDDEDELEDDDRRFLERELEHFGFYENSDVETDYMDDEEEFVGEYLERGVDTNDDDDDDEGVEIEVLQMDDGEGGGENEDDPGAWEDID